MKYYKTDQDGYYLLISVRSQETREDSFAIGLNYEEFLCTRDSCTNQPKQILVAHNFFNVATELNGDEFRKEIRRKIAELQLRANNGEIFTFSGYIKPMSLLVPPENE